MPGKKRSGRKPQNGKGFFDAVKKVNKFLKDNKIISQGASVVGNVASRFGGPYGTQIATISKGVEDTATKYGYGYRKKRVVRK